MTMLIFAQIAAPASGSIENWLLSAAAIASMALLAKKLFLTKAPREPEYVTKTEFHQELKDVRETMDKEFRETRKYIAMTQDFLFRTNEVQTASIHRRLIALGEAVARVDERTKSAEKA